jgi:heme A synthase
MFNRVLAFLAGLVAFALSVYAYLERRLMGFPDGFLTELDRAERCLFDIFIPVQVYLPALGSFSGMVGTKKTRGKKIIRYYLFLHIFYCNFNYN